MKQYLFLFLICGSLLKASDGYESESEELPVILKPKAIRRVHIFAGLDDIIVPAAPASSDFEKVCKFRRDAENFVQSNFIVDAATAPATLLLVYEVPQFRNAVRAIVTIKLAQADPTILLLAQDMPQLRPKVAPIVEKLLKTNHAPKILQVALEIPALRQKALAVIERALEEPDKNNFDPEMLLLAHGVPGLCTHVEVFVEQIFEQNSHVSEILDIALKMPSLRKAAIGKMNELLEGHNPQILRVAMSCPSVPMFYRCKMC